MARLCELRIAAVAELGAARCASEPALPLRSGARVCNQVTVGLMDELWPSLAACDLAFTSTSATGCIVTLPELTQVLRYYTTVLLL